MIAPTISVSTAYVAVAHPNASWSRTIKVRDQDEPAGVTLHPTLGMTNASGQWVPVKLPWIHITPATVTLHNGHWTSITITSATPHPHEATALNLAMLLRPTATHGTGIQVMSAPAVRVLLGTDPGVNHAQTTVQMPWIVWGAGPVTAHITVTDTGATWFAPALRVQEGSTSAPTMPLPVLLPSLHAHTTATVQVPAVGWTAATFSAAGAAPVTRHILSLPGLPIAAALLAGSLVEGWNLVSRKQKITHHKGDHIDE